jgi:hypothetical protein
VGLVGATLSWVTSDDLNPEALTGTGRTHDVAGTRSNAAPRSQTRCHGIDAAAVRQDAETERWGTTLPALPWAKDGGFSARHFSLVSRRMVGGCASTLRLTVH